MVVEDMYIKLNMCVLNTEMAHINETAPFQLCLILAQVCEGVCGKVFTTDMKSGREGPRNTAVVYKIDPLVPGGLICRRRDIKNTSMLILATNHRAVYMRTTF